jgi:aldose sugar dehydrogenase
MSLATPRPVQFFTLSALMLLAACGGKGGEPLAATVTLAAQGWQVVPLASGLAYPWSGTYLPDGRLMITERDGRVRLMSPNGQLSTALSAGPTNIDVNGQGGLLGVALDPAFANNRRVYLAFAEQGQGTESGLNGTAVWRGVLNSAATGFDQGTVIWRQQPKVNSSGHFGGRLVFDRQGHLLVTLGDRQSRRDDAQIKANHLGKVVRITTNGTPAPGNPWLSEGGPAADLWSMGHRNVQGAAIHPSTGELWTHEHGPQGGDEVNLDLAGHNYGWPVITYGCEYVTCLSIGEGTTKAGMDQPLTWWPKPSTAPSGMAFYTGKMFPQWQGSLFVGALAGQTLWRLTLDGNRVVSKDSLLPTLGQRIRDVIQAPDGSLILLTDSAQGQVLQLKASQ